MKRWEIKEKELLIELLENKFTYEEISNKLKRTKKSIRLKANKLGYTSKSFNGVIIKNCLKCHKPLHISANNKLKIKFCNHSCSITYHNEYKYKETTKCEYCSNVIKNGKYCGYRCKINNEYEVYIKKWKNGEVDGMKKGFVISNYVRNYILNKYDNECSKCKWSELNKFSNKIPLEIDHIDGNYKNSKESNLLLLCPNCHSLTSTYKGLNRGNGRELRGKKVVKKVVDKNICKCGKEINVKSKRCNKCHTESLKLVKRPPYNILIKEIEGLGYSGVGRKYGVSGTSIRKWIK